MATAAPAGTARGGRAAEGGAALARLGCGGGRKGEPRWRFLKFAVFSPRQGRWLVARGFQPLVHVSHSGPRDFQPLAIFPCPFRQRTNSATSKLALLGVGCRKGEPSLTLRVGMRRLAGGIAARSTLEQKDAVGPLDVSQSRDAATVSIAGKQDCIDMCTRTSLA